MDRRKQIQKQLAARRQTTQKKSGRSIEMQDVGRGLEGHKVPNTKKNVGVNRFILQITISGCLFFAVGILYQTSSERIEPAQAFVENAFEEHFQFAAVSDYFEKHFGSPLQLLPDQRVQEQEAEHLDYALPASGTIRESFEEDGEGILLETGAGEEVKAVKGGHVMRVTSDDQSGLGNTIELQHPDGTTSIYGMLDQVSVQPYDILASGSVIGTVTQPDDEQSGLFYFALKQGGNYIDPSEVIDFD